MVRVGRRPQWGLAVAVCCSVCWGSFAFPVSAEGPAPAPEGNVILQADATSEDAGEIVLVGDKVAESETPHRLDPQTVPKGNSSSKVRNAARASLPLAQMTPEARQRADTVLSDTSYFRRMPTLVFPVDNDVYQYFISHPDVAVSVWRAMEISHVQMWQTGAVNYEADAGDGTTGRIDVLYRTGGHHVAISEGEYKSPLMKKPIKAKSLIHLDFSFSRGADGAIYCTHRADLFVSFPSHTIEAAAKILSPLTGPLIDRTFNETSLFLRMMSLAMARRPDWVQQISAKLEGVHEVRKTQLMQLTVQVYNTERKRLDENALRDAKAVGGTSGIATLESKDKAQR